MANSDPQLKHKIESTKGSTPPIHSLGGLVMRTPKRVVLHFVEASTFTSKARNVILSGIFSTASAPFWTIFALQRTRGQSFLENGFFWAAGVLTLLAIGYGVSSGVAYFKMFRNTEEISLDVDLAQEMIKSCQQQRKP